jgi:hypothetical protein
MGETVEKCGANDIDDSVNREPKSSDNDNTTDSYLAELTCENKSTSSLHSDHSQLDESEGPDSLREDNCDVQSQNSGLDSVEDNISCNLDDESQECIGHLVRVFCLLKKCAQLSITRIMIFTMPGNVLLGPQIYTEIL